MFHSGAQALIDIWADLPRNGRYPARASFDPGALGAALARAFMLETADAGLTFRLAGSGVERLYGRPLRGRCWNDLWSHDTRLLVRRTAAQALSEARPMVIHALAGPAAAPFEIILAPLAGQNGGAPRLLGLYQPTTAEAADLEGLQTMSARLAVAAPIGDRLIPRLAVLDGRRIA